MPNRFWSRVPAILFAAAVSMPCGSGASGFVKVVRDGEVWWFEAAGGKRFFSLGVDCAGGCYGHYEGKPMAGGRREWILSSLEKWGFNTAACWSSPSLWDGMYFADQIYPGFEHAGNDVFDDDLWDGWLERDIREETRAFAGRRNFIGYFLDNEVPWDPARVIRYYLGLSGSSPGSAELIRFGKDVYGGRIDDLNAEWGTGYPGFAALPGSRPPKKPPPAFHRFAAKWRNRVAAEYYRRYSGIVRDADPDHLILGIRYSGIPDMDLFKAVSPYFDVNSVNDYTRYGNLNPAYAELYAATGKPLMITEWSFSGYPEPGRKSLQFVDVYTQERRAHGYRKYVLNAARAPFMVGMHWFLWSDYWPRDRTEGEYLPDGNMGLVSSDEKTVYEELVTECARTNREAEAAHRKAAWREEKPEAETTKEIGAFVPDLDGDVSEWPAALSVTPVLAESLMPDARFSHIYYVSWGPGAVYVAGDISDSRIDFPGRDWSWQGDYLSVIVSSVAKDEFGDSPSVFVHLHPVGGGADGKAPYGNSWGAFRDDGEIAVSRRERPGGYFIEAAIPAGSLPGFGAGSKWIVELNYRNINEIYETRWAGEVELRE